MTLLALLCRFYQLSGVVARDRMDITRALHDGKKSIELAFSDTCCCATTSWD